MSDSVVNELLSDFGAFCGLISSVRSLAIGAAKHRLLAHVLQTVTCDVTLTYYIKKKRAEAVLLEGTKNAAFVP